MSTAGSKHYLCIAVSVAMLLLVILAGIEMARMAPALLEVYGLPADAFEIDWRQLLIIVPVILGSMVAVLRSKSIAEERKCRWILGMVLLFPVSTVVLAVRLMRRENG